MTLRVAACGTMLTLGLLAVGPGALHWRGHANIVQDLGIVAHHLRGDRGVPHLHGPGSGTAGAAMGRILPRTRALEVTENRVPMGARRERTRAESIDFGEILVALAIEIVEVQKDAL